MVQQAQRAAGRIELPQSADRGRFLILVELRIEMRLAVARPVTGEDDTVVAVIDRRNVVVVSRLAGHARDHCRLALPQPADLVDLPLVSFPDVLLRRRADDHAEQRFITAPVNGWIAYGDRVGALKTGHAEATLGGQIAQRAIRVANPQVAAAAHGLQLRVVVAEYRPDRGEIGRNGDLGDEQDRIRRVDRRSRIDVLATAGKHSQRDSGAQQQTTYSLNHCNASFHVNQSTTNRTKSIP